MRLAHPTLLFFAFPAAVLPASAAAQEARHSATSAAQPDCRAFLVASAGYQ